MNQTVRKEFETPDPIGVYVELPSGSLTVRASTTTTAEVTITGPRAEEFLVELTGDQLGIIAPRGRFFGHDDHRVEVGVPEGSDLVTRTGSADTETRGTLGRMKLKSGSGDVTIDAAEGPVLVESGSGDVTGGVFEAEVRVKSGSGDVVLEEVHGVLGVSTGSGDVRLGTVHATAVVKSGSGDLEVARASTDVQFTTASGDLRIERAATGGITTKSATGDIEVGVPLGTPVWADVNTITGDVTSDLASTGKPTEGQQHLEIRAHTVSGDVRLVQV